MDLSEAIKILEKNGVENPKFDAQVLLAHAFGISREELLMNARLPDKETTQEFVKYITRRADREPLSHIVGKREFYGREFIVTKDVLDPRSDTETLIDEVLKRISQKNAALNILDIGTGSGCLAITLLAELPNAKAVAIDISEAAIVIAKKNAAKHLSSNRLELKCCKMSEIQGEFDVVISNPPYIATAEIAALMPEVVIFEPFLALDGGKDGLDCYRILASKASGLLAPDGLMVLEIGNTQASDVSEIMLSHALQIEDIANDLEGRNRCIVISHKT